jgi:hypothetical protein
MSPLTAFCFLIVICFGMMVAQVFTTLLAYLAAFLLVGAIILLFVKGVRSDSWS